MKKIIKSYYKIFDKKLGSGVPIVLIITFLIGSIGNIANAGKNSNDKNINKTLAENVIIFDGKTYMLID